MSKTMTYINKTRTQMIRSGRSRSQWNVNKTPQSALKRQSL